jgi:hypothetical protein
VPPELISVTVPPEATGVETGPGLPGTSLTALAANLSITVPDEQDDSTTVIDDPDEAEGVKTQPVAVPVFEKSAEVSPVTGSEKVKV